MSFLSFFSSKEKKEKSFDKYGDTLKKALTTKEQRIEAIEALEKIEPQWSIPQLLKRFELVTESGLQDTKEKERCLEAIVKHKEKAKDFVVLAIKTQKRISWPIKAAEKIFSKEEYIDLLLEEATPDIADFDEVSLERNEDILLALKETRHEKIISKAASFLHNRNENLKMAALECLEEQAKEYPLAKEMILNLSHETISDSNSRFLGVVKSIVEQHGWNKSSENHL